MINLQFNIRNPWSQAFKTVKSWTGSTPIKNKYWEFELYRDSSLLSINFAITTRQSHAGFDVELGLLGYCAHFVFYDNRHWSYTENRYEHYEGEGDHL